MKTKLLKNLAFVFILALSCSIYAQENFDFTALDCSGSKYTATQATLTCDTNGFNFAVSGNTFFESRINGVKSDGQNKITINYTNSSNADGVFFKASSAALEGAVVQDLGATSVEYTFTDLNFTDPDGGGGGTGGTIQLRSRFVNKAGDALTGSMLLTSMVIEDVVLGVEDVFSRANTVVIVKDRKIEVKNAPDGSVLSIYNILGQTVENNNYLSSGAYIVKLNAQGAVLTKKIMIL